MTDPTDSHITEILRGPDGPHIAAFFDFDGTLVDGLSFTAFLRRPGLPSKALLGGLLRTRPILFWRLARGALRAEPSDDDVRAAYDLVLGFWCGHREEILQRHAHEVFALDLAARLRHGTWSFVQAHRRKGHTVVLVSSATRYQIAPAADELGIDHLLCSEMEVEEGTFTGRLGGPLLRGKAKASAVGEFAASRGIDLRASHAYADTADDVPFLETVGHPCAICPADGLSSLAAERGWACLPVSRGPLVRPGHRGRTMRRLKRRPMADGESPLAGIRLRVDGARFLSERRPVVFLLNHRSPLDPAVIAELLGPDHRHGDVLFMGRGAEPGIAVDRLSRGHSVVIASERTRSLTPMPGPFANTAFLIARSAGVPVVPVVIRDIDCLLPCNTAAARAGTVHVVVHEPMDITGDDAVEASTRIEEVRRLYVDTLITGSPSSPVKPVTAVLGAASARGRAGGA
ncbi:HAD-IB family hydrolase [Actinomadura rubrisoli]|uniref:HAD-IB family hydrolase n=1 Tax=Actinomadura rubrisoli TaxID=2530368 RepID=UPI0014053DBD|nr:HAD-IB family hydrolase [Actinomadura rubrisoli]